MKEGSHIKSERVRKVQNGPTKKTQVDSKGKDMSAFRVDKFIAGRTKWNKEQGGTVYKE